MLRIPRKLAMWGGAAALAGAGFAFMASNTFTSTPSAGVGTTAISGYTVGTTVLTGCGSTTNPTNPEDICYVHFTLTPSTAGAATAGTAYVKFTKATGGTTHWYKCTADTYVAPHVRKFTCDLRTQATGPVYTTVTTITVSANDPLA